HGEDAVALHWEWSERALAMGHEPEPLVAQVLAHPSAGRVLDGATRDQIVADALEALAESQSTWRPAELVRELAAADLPYERQFWPREEALSFFADRGEPLKVVPLRDDLARGGHIRPERVHLPHGRDIHLAGLRPAPEQDDSDDADDDDKGDEGQWAAQHGRKLTL
ncbi:MAG: hypothetical protein ACLGHP_05510, partial [Vicinamibacteria bacterium]